MSNAFRFSIGANIALLVVVGALLWRERPPMKAAGVKQVKTTPSRGELVQTDTGWQSTFNGPKLNAITIAQLEKQGVSRDVLVDVVLEDLNRRSEQRVLFLRKKYAPKLVPDREYVELSRQSDAERARELKALFGEEGYLAWDKEQTLRRLSCANPAGVQMTAVEAEQAYRLQKEFEEKNRDLQMAMEDGVADRADAGTLQAQAQQRLDRELEKLLGKQRFDELRGNADPATEVVRMYGDLNPSPEQARAVVQAEQAYRAQERALAERVKMNPIEAADLAAQLKALSESQDATMRQILGAGAYDTIKRQNDPTYKTLKQFAEAWDLKDNEVQSVYAVLHAFELKSGYSRGAAEMSEANGQRINWRVVNASIEQSRQQAEMELLNVIGAERLRRLRQNGLLAE